MFNKMSLYRVKKGLVYLRYFGPKEFLIRLKERIRFHKIDYEKWYQNHRRTKEELERQRQEAFSYAPLISIVVPVYQAPEQPYRVPSFYKSAGIPTKASVSKTLPVPDIPERQY